MLDDRLGYGLFPDYYLSSLLMDTFLKASNYRDAVKTAILMMIQEEFDHPIASHLALYSCHAYLKNPTPEPWDPLPKPKPEEPKEIVKVRVDYIREPFFDDHFDITNSQHLIGKTLVGIAKHIGSSSKDSVAQTSLLLGWTLYQKFDKVLQTLDAVLESKQQIFKEGLEHCQKIVSESADLSADFLENFQTRVSQLEKEGLIIDGDILEIIKQQTNEIVSKNEQDDIQKQVNCYREWDILREKEVENQIRELEYRQRQAVIDAKKKALLETEERLNFFDNIDEWELRFEQKEEERKLHQAKMVGSGKTESAKRLKQAEEDSYVPPEIVKKISLTSFFEV
nr:EOG090X05Q1 [Polyphemus pediculus]